MPNVCRECIDGRWECGEEQELCGDFGDLDRLGDCYIPVGVGNMVVVVTVYSKVVNDKCVVRLVKHCPKHCRRRAAVELS